MASRRSRLGPKRAARVRAGTGTSTPGPWNSAWQGGGRDLTWAREEVAVVVPWLGGDVMDKRPHHWWWQRILTRGWVCDRVGGMRRRP